jgi:signal transduction histidine kinase
MSNLAATQSCVRQPVGRQSNLKNLDDVSDRDESVAELSARAAHRFKLLGEMAGGVAHDFRNILAVIDSSLRLIEKQVGDREKVKMYMAGARDGIERGTRLTSQLLRFAKHQELEMQLVNANESLRSLDLFLKYGAGLGIRIVLSLADDIPRCIIDPSQFSAAILNLVFNARDAMPNGGQIRISTARCLAEGASGDISAPSVYVRIRVEDEGQGMSPDVMRKIFEPFFTTKGESGTGLGLPQVQAFMRQVGGYVEIASEFKHGTAIDLMFPAAERLNDA